MILADTSVWISHIREGEPHLQRALVDAKVFMHPFVLGEIACGNLRGRSQTLHRLARLPSPVSASNDEVLTLLERHHLFGKGLGWVDELRALFRGKKFAGVNTWGVSSPILDNHRSCLSG